MYLTESIETDSGTLLYVFSRDGETKKMDVVRNFLPYFYVSEEEHVPDDVRIIKVEPGYTAIDGVKVKKIFVRSSKEVIDVREMFVNPYEADIPYTNRYIIDEIGEATIYPLRVLYVDIEVDSENDFPDLESPNQAITCIALTDSFTRETKMLFYQNPLAPVKLEEQDGVTIYETEEDMLCGFIANIKRFDPDVLSGWNVEDFDFTYLIRRMKMLKVNYSGLSPLDKVWISKYGDVNIKGRILLDGMESYMHFRKMSNQGKAESYSLEYTAQNELGVGKLQHEENFHELWFYNPQKLVDYNKRDNELVMRIIEKNQIFDFFNQLRSKSCSQLKNVFHASTLVDGTLLHREHNKTVFPSRQKSSGEDFSGAFVIPPTPGLYDGVLALDVKGMYPNIIKTFNVGYETLNPDGNIVLGDIRFDSGEGIISAAIIDLEKERNNQKKLMWAAKSPEEKNFYHFRQYAVKVLMNSIYGYLGFPSSRLYKREVAEAITTTGRELIFWSKKMLEDKGYQIVYGDTDSVYVKAKSDSLPIMKIEGQKLVEYLNNSYIQFCKERGSDNCTLEMEFEKIFKKILFVGKRDDASAGAKKKYAYILSWKDGADVEENVDVSGFEYVRSDSPRIAREVQKKVIDMVLTGEKRDVVYDYLLDIEKKIKNGQIDDDQIGFPKGINNHLTEYKTSSPVVRGCLYSNKFLGTRFTKGSKPKWIFIKDVPKGYPNTDVISYEYEIPKGFTIDYKPLLDRIFKMKLEAIWRAVGWGDFPIIDSSIKTLDAWGV